MTSFFMYTSASLAIGWAACLLYVMHIGDFDNTWGDAYNRIESLCVSMASRLSHLPGGGGSCGPLADGILSVKIVPPMK